MHNKTIQVRISGTTPDKKKISKEITVSKSILEKTSLDKLVIEYLEKSGIRAHELNDLKFETYDPKAVFNA